VPLDAYKIAQVYGFNFKEDINALKDKIAEDIEISQGEYRSVRTELLNYLKTLNTSTLEGVREMYDNIEELRIWLDTAMRYSNDIEEYEAYKKIYNSILLSNDTKDLYMKNDGTFAETYAELLQDRRPDLYEIYMNTGNPSVVTEPGTTTGPYSGSFSINNKINKVLEKLSLMSEDLADIRFANDKDAMVSNIEKLINQMKSYTVDQSASAILYLINDPHMCMLKLIDAIRGTTMERTIIDKLQELYLDTLHQIHICRTWKTKLKFMEGEIISSKLNYFNHVLHVFDKFKEWNKECVLDMDTLVWDLFHDYMKSVGLFHVLITHEEIYSDTNADVFDIIHLYSDKLTEILKTGDVNVPLYLDEYIGKHADCFIPASLSLLYDIVSDVDVDMYERIHLKEFMSKIKERCTYNCIISSDILISSPITYNGDGINTGELLLKDFLRYGFHPIKISYSDIQNKYIEMQQNCITITHEFGSEDQLDTVDDHCLFTHELIKVYNNED
jgi:hypothetical protein